MTLATDKRALAKKLKKDCQICFKKNQDVGLVKVNGRMVYGCSKCAVKQKG